MSAHGAIPNLPAKVLAEANALFRAEASAKGRAAAERAVEGRADLAHPILREAFIGSYAEAWAEQYIEGALRERARIRGIVLLPEAANKQAEALHLALESRLQPAEAAFFLQYCASEVSIRRSPSSRADQISRLALSAGMSGRA